MQFKIGTPFLALLALTLAGASGPGNSALAQSDSAISRALGAAIDVHRQMLSASKNLWQMEQGLSPTERYVVDDFLSARCALDGAYSEAIRIGLLLSMMKYPEDYATVRMNFGESSRNLMSVADAKVKFANETLTNITTAAVLAEAIKLRDEMVKLRELFEPFASKPGA